MIAKGLTYRIVLSILFMILLLGVSCGDSDADKNNILTQSQMVKALMEVYLSEQKINKLGLPRDSAEAEFKRFRPVIFEKVGVSDSAFKKSFDYYMDHPVEMEKIYTALVDSLSLMEQRLDSSK